MPVRGNGNKDALNSNARISLIDTFFPLVLNWEMLGGKPKATFDHLEYIDYGESLTPLKERFVKDMPLIVQGDGKPWDLGNLYLIWLFHNKLNSSDLHMDTIRSNADSLLHYLRWIEHMQQLFPKIHVFYLPEDQPHRVTYRYRRYLGGLIKKQIIKPSTANKRMNAIVAFYRRLISEGLAKYNYQENLPFEEVEKTIRTTNQIGLTSFKTVTSSDLAIKVPECPDSIEFINDDGEKLRPLSQGDQDLILEAIQRRGNRTMQLIFWLALFTGARIQTCATLRICSLKKAYETQSHKSEVLVKVGTSVSLVDTKGSKTYTLYIPTILVEQMIQYINSPLAHKLRAKSFYGETDYNYIFLTKNGDPFITSSQEMKDRQESKYSSRLSLADRIDFKWKKGQAIRDFVNKITNDIRNEFTEFRHFRFHDLRASFAKNYLDTKMANPVFKTLSDGSKVDTRRSNALKDTSKRMGHTSEKTTELYLDYQDTIVSERAASQVFTDKLYGMIDSQNKKKNV